MASALSNQSLYFFRPLLPSKPINFSQSMFSPIHKTNKNGLKFVISQLNTRHFRVSPKVAETDAKTINGDEEQGKNEVQRDFPIMKLLIQAYKKAILDGDEQSISEIESAICIIETEKNDLSNKIGEITTEIASGKDKFLRLKADLENYRKKTEKDHLRLTSNVQGEVIESLLPLVDSFEKAKQHLKPESEKEKKIDTSYQGIYKQFVEIMRSLRVSVVGTVGKPFDPSIHEAVAREESQTYKTGVIIEEIRRGFVLGDRLLRPASVKVSMGPGPGKAPLATEPTISEGSEHAEVESSSS